MKYIWTIILVTCISALASTAFADDAVWMRCGTRGNADLGSLAGLDDIGGKHITADGTLRILVVFVSFFDDETPHPYWPAHNPPLYMQQFIDPDTATNSQSLFNLTNYFHQMSLGKFHVVGEARWVELLHSQEEYRNGSYGRANRTALQECVDPIIDFTQYDRWTKVADFTHTLAPDSIVDMIVMVWRTNMFENVGEASLGYRGGFYADGRRIESGFPEYLPMPLGSGVTCQYLYTDSPYKVMQTMVHEMGHWLLGGPHPYNNESVHGKHVYWGILCNGLRAASCANSYEREKLGWIEVPVIVPGDDVTLRDYITTGSAFKYRPPNGEVAEFFYLENHQLTSPFDDITINSEDKGIWVLHQQGPYMELDNLKIRPSDGFWNWENPGVTSACFSQSLPMFQRGSPRIRTGLSHRDQIPTNASATNWMNVLRSADRSVNCGSYYLGQSFNGAFSLGSTPVFSPYSNPGTSTWENNSTPFSLEIVSEANGIVTARSHANLIEGSPARRYMGPDPTVQPPPGVLSLAWGTQWNEGQPLEADVTWSELEKQIGTTGTWNTAYRGPALTWTDTLQTYDTSGSIPIWFRVRVRDAGGKLSTWSNVVRTTVNVVNEVANEVPTPVNEYALDSNYPNPFNSTTVIRYSIPVATSAYPAGRYDPASPADGHTSLRVFDILGREVATLVDEIQGPGFKTVTFDASALASGVYFYRLHAGEFVSVKKMLFLK